MKKIFLIYLIATSILYGYNYNELLLKAQASMFPKIMMLDKNLKNKLVDGYIVYTIVYNKNDYLIASEVKESIEMIYKGKFDGYRYKINLVEFSNIKKQTRTSVFYVLNSSDEDIQQVAKFAKEQGIISFCYDENNLKDGLLFSLVLEKSTVFYLNKNNLDTKKVNFVDSLLQMVRYID